jgi:hypothetical protein
VSAAVLEWTIAFGFTFYLLTFWYDLRMAKGMHKGQLGRENLMAEQNASVRPSYATDGTHGAYGQPAYGQNAYGRPAY